MKILVTGICGYIGSRLASSLRRRGHEVAGVDACFFARESCLYDPAEPPFPIARKDIRHLSAADLEGFEAVVHLAELSNDPMGQLRPELTRAINHRGSVRLAGLCREARVPRFVYSSSCSVYGTGTEDVKTEDSPVNPQTVYAECKVLVERDVAAMADERFSPVFLRNATAYGPSPRMRFDLVLNNLCGMAWTTGKVSLISDGKPWRPLAHVEDICEAMACALDAPPETIRNQVLNVGASTENYRVAEIADIVSSTFPGCERSLGSAGGDNRSYRVAFDRIGEVLPAYRARRDAVGGATELRQLFERIGLTQARFEDRAFTRVKQLQHLLHTGLVDGELLWTQR